MNTEDEKFKIKFKDGRVRTLIAIDPNEKEIRDFFQSYTKIDYDSDGWIYLLVVQALKKWLNINGFNHPAASELISVAELIVASAEAIQWDGFVAITEEENECLVVCINNDCHYVQLISKMIYNDIVGRRISINKLIVNIKCLNLRNGDNLEDLTYWLNRALETEDYEQAVELRDKINILGKK
jgi:hypothetical protein